MKKIYYQILMLIFGIHHIATAQNNFGPRLTSLGKNSAAVRDIWSTDANAAGITGINSPTIAINYAKHLLSNEISKQAIAFVLPIKQNFIGLSFQRYGISEYNEIKAGFAAAKKFGDVLSISIRGNFHQIKISNYGATTGFSIDIGGMYIFNEQLTVGLYLNNPSLQKYNTKAIATDIPTTIYIGGAYHVSDKLLIASTVSKDIKTAIDVGLGVDYKLLNILSLRGGLTAKPFKQYAGFGLSYRKLFFDFAVENDPNLDYTPQIALAYAF